MSWSENSEKKINQWNTEVLDQRQVTAILFQLLDQLDLEAYEVEQGCFCASSIELRESEE